jgi:hypothetical protein
MRSSLPGPYATRMSHPSPHGEPAPLVGYGFTARPGRLESMAVAAPSPGSMESENYFR